MKQSVTSHKLQGREERTASLKSPGLFPAGLTVDRTFKDIDELAAAVRQWDEEGVQLQPGPFRARLNLLHTTALQIQRVRLSGCILARGSATRGSVVIGLQTKGASRAIWRGRPLEPDTLAVFDGRAEIDFQTTCPSEVMVVSIEESLLARHWEALYGHALAPQISGERIKISSPAMVESLIQCWSEQTDVALTKSQCLTDDHFARLFEATIIEALQVNPRDIPRQPAPAERRRAARQAREQMLLRMDQPMTIADICRGVGTVERTLHLGFRECFGMTPKRFLKMLRLNAARKCLKHPQQDTTVTGVAMQWGFFHSGRFARDYKQSFAETPSETLQRVRGER